MGSNPRFASLTLALAASTLVGCQRPPETATLQPANLEMCADRLTFGEANRGDRLTRTCIISNSGDVSLGISSIVLGTGAQDGDPPRDTNPDRGHAGAYKLIWSCNDVEIPTVIGSGDDEQAAKGRPRLDSGFDSGPDSGPAETGGDTGPSGNPNPDAPDLDVPENLECYLPPGARLPIRVEFSPTVAGENWDSIIVTTEDVEYDADGDGRDDEGSPAIEDRIYRDADQTWRMTYLRGTGIATEPRPDIGPNLVDFGFVFSGQSARRYIRMRNSGDGELEITRAAIDEENCSDGFRITRNPAANPVFLGSDIAKYLEIEFAAPRSRAAQCYVDVDYRYLDEDEEVLGSERILMRANVGENPDNTCPFVRVVEPAPGYQHLGPQPVRVKIELKDPDEPISNLSCKVRSAFQGLEDGKVAVGDCRPEKEGNSDLIVMDIPVVDNYVQPGKDVWEVRVVDQSACIRTATVPVLLNADYSPGDDDGDGFDESEGDCDDNDPEVYPGAGEGSWQTGLPDRKDNDCDGLIDEQTDNFDDDGDGQSEADGDCNDSSASTYQGAPEAQDLADNDCDGLVDEGTELFDDDGDGFSELDLDCDDRDPAISPGALEICGDGIDNDCNLLIDQYDDCVQGDAEPMLVGRINLTRTAVEVGGSSVASVLVYHPEGDEVQHEWEVGQRAPDAECPEEATVSGLYDATDEATFGWTAPSELSRCKNSGAFYRLVYQGADGDFDQVSDFGQIEVYPERTINEEIVVVVEEQDDGTGAAGCNTVPLLPVGFVFGGGFLVAALRRRRREV